jgi:tRNA(fMet)-specific endonuclease VapC
MPFLLDTNICIYLLKNNPPHVRSRIKALRFGDLTISSITLAELYFGAAKSSNPDKNLKALQGLIGAIIPLPFDEQCAYQFGLLRANLEKRGNPIGPYDMLIAAQALSTRSILVTNNVREFRRIPDLEIENWAQQ